MPFLPGLLRTASSPHRPLTRGLESILGQSPCFLAAWRVRGSHSPSQAELSEPLLGPVPPWGFSLPFQVKGLSLHVSDQLPGRVEGWGMQRGAGMGGVRGGVK